MKKVMWASGVIFGAGCLVYYNRGDVGKERNNTKELEKRRDNLLFTSKLLNFKKYSDGNPMIESIDCKYLELISDYLVFNLKSLPVSGVKNSSGVEDRISSGTCFVTSPMNNSSCEYIYLVTAAHCVVNKEGKAKRIGLIPKKKEGLLSNQKLKSDSGDLIECQIVCCEYDGDRDVDFAILKCSRKEFLEKNGFKVEIPWQYFIPKIGEFKSDTLNNVIVGYPSKYKEYRDNRVKEYNFEKLNGLMMTYQKRPVFSFGRYLKSEATKANISVFTNTINKGFSGGPSFEWNENSSDDPIPKFHGIVTLFGNDGYGSFDVSNEEFRRAYFSHIELPSSENICVKKALEEYQNK